MLAVAGAVAAALVLPESNRPTMLDIAARFCEEARVFAAGFDREAFGEGKVTFCFAVVALGRGQNAEACGGLLRAEPLLVAAQATTDIGDDDLDAARNYITVLNCR